MFSFYVFMKSKKVISKFLFLVLTITIVVSGSGVYISQHQCHECGKSDVYFLEKAHCCCSEHMAHHIHSEICYDHVCQSGELACKHQCKTSDSYFKIPFFPIKKVSLVNPLKIELFTNFYNLKENLLQTENKFDNISNKESPPLFIQKNDFLNFIQQRIFYC